MQTNVNFSQIGKAQAECIHLKAQLVKSSGELSQVTDAIKMITTSLEQEGQNTGGKKGGNQTVLWSRISLEHADNYLNYLK